MTPWFREGTGGCVSTMKAPCKGGTVDKRSHRWEAVARRKVFNFAGTTMGM